MSKKLKPCPFCGREVNIGLHVGLESGKSCFYIYCENCDLGFSKGDVGKEELTTEWNTRAETETKNQWRKYPDTQPIEEGYYLIVEENEYMYPDVTCGYFSGEKSLFLDIESWKSVPDVTYWRPLPEPPKEE